MTVCRLPHHDGNYTIISNSIFTSGRLSGRAIGVLVVLLSKPADWRISSESLAKTLKEGRDAIRKALRELKELGYIVYKKIQDPATGQWSTTSTVYEVPVEVDADEEPQESVTPRPGNPATGIPTVGEPGPTQRGSSQKKETNQPQAPKKAPESNAPASKLVVGESRTDERLEALEKECQDRALMPRFDLASPDKIDAVADLLNAYTPKELADHALKMQTPGNPTRWLGGLLRIWQGMPSQRKPAATASKYCDQCKDSFGWAGENERGQMIRCSCQMVGAA